MQVQNDYLTKVETKLGSVQQFQAKEERKFQAEGSAYAQGWG